jgi:SET domain-containing protein
MARKYIPADLKLLVKRSPTGLGLFAGDAIPKNTCIIEYVGRQVSERESETSRSKYLFEVNKKKTIDGKPRINKAGYLNHSCRPNAESVIHKQRVFIFSTRAIKPGEEITYDYGKEYIKEHCTPCRCAKCMPELHAAFKRPKQAVH